MATINLSNYNLSELKALKHDVEKEITDRQQQEVKKAREKILAMAQDLGVSVDDLVAKTGKRTRAENAENSRRQYKNPANNSQTWSGRGRQPKWIVDGLASGKGLEDYRI